MAKRGNSSSRRTRLRCFALRSRRGKEAPAIREYLAAVEEAHGDSAEATEWIGRIRGYLTATVASVFARRAIRDYRSVMVI